MEVVLLGTGSPIPDPLRGGPATLLRVDGSQLLIDAGRACVMRLAAAGSLPAFLSGVLITHLHSDHLTDLNDIITTHWVMSQEPVTLRIWGPPGIDDFVRRTMESLAPDVGYRLAHHGDLTWEPVVEVTEVIPGQSFVVGSFSVTVHQTDHSPVHPTIGYRVEHDGKAVAMAGDTIPCPGLDEMCSGADAYVQTVIRRDLVEMVPNVRFRDIVDYHSSVLQAARTAARNGVRILVMTHMVPPVGIDQYPEWIRIAGTEFDGEIVIGDDLTAVML